MLQARRAFERREQNEVCQVLSNHYSSNHYLKKRGRRKSQQSRFSNLPSSRSGEGVVGVLDTDLSQRRPVARLAGSWEILDELTFGVSRVDADRWIWSALGIHRVPYEFWKVGTWKPAVNARSTDSHFLSLSSLDLVALPVLSGTSEVCSSWS